MYFDVNSDLMILRSKSNDLFSDQRNRGGSEEGTGSGRSDRVCL